MVVLARALVPSDHNARLQRRNLLEGGYPFSTGLRIGFAQEDVNVVLSGIARTWPRDETLRKFVSSVLEWPAYDSELTPLELEDIALERLGDGRLLRDLARKPWTPKTMKNLLRAACAFARPRSR